MAADDGLAGTAARLQTLPQPRVLVIVMRRLGDVLLTTPLIRTVRKALPRALIDVLVFRGTEGVLAGNPDIARVITLPSKPSRRELLALIGALRRQYDLALSTQPGDRPIMLAWVAGRIRAGIVQDAGRGAWWKRHALDLPVAARPDEHRVPELLRLVVGLGFAPDGAIVCPAVAPAHELASALPNTPYAVLHANPLYRFRRWHDEGWRALARALAGRGLEVVTTGGPDPAERAYLDAVWTPAKPAVHRLDGKLAWPELAALIRGAAVYVGPDTSMTHLAAGTGCPTVALYGPASPRLIGPWPVGGLAEPWAHVGPVQRRGNVWVVQNPLPCMPCDALGCERHLQSRAACLDELASAQVLAVVEEALNSLPKPQVDHA